jgi:hypothetical protein
MVILNDELGTIERGYGYTNGIIAQFAWMNRVLVKVRNALGIFGMYSEIPNTNLQPPKSNAKALPLSTIFSKLHCTEMKELVINFNVHGSVHCKNILIYIQKDATLHSLFYLETALHVSGGTITHHQECKQLYLQHLVFVKYGLTNTRCCRYSCFVSWWWVVVPPETCRTVSR